MLKELQMNYLSKDKESLSMYKKLQHAISVLNNKRQLFTIDPGNSLMNDESDQEEEKKSDKFFSQQPSQLKRTSTSFKRRHSLQVGSNWMQMYSGYNMENI